MTENWILSILDSEIIWDFVWMFCELWTRFPTSHSISRGPFTRRKLCLKSVSQEMKTPPKYFTAKDTSWCGSDNTCECTLSVKRMEKPQSLRGYYSVYRHRDSHNVLRKGTDYFNKKVSCEKMIIVGFLRCKIICSKPEDVHGGTPTTYKLDHQPSWCHHVLQTVCNLSWEPTPENNHENLVMSRYQFTHKLTACVDHNHALGSFRAPLWKSLRNLSRKTLWIGTSTFQGKDFWESKCPSPNLQPFTVGDWWIY